MTQVIGRPPKYSKEIITKTKKYLNELPKDEVIPSIEGLSDYLCIARSTLYEWNKQEDKKEFSDIFRQILNKQAKILFNQGLKGKFNSVITKVMLSKHGYSDKLIVKEEDPFSSDDLEEFK